MASLIIKGSLIKTVIFDFDGTLTRLNIDFARMRREVMRIIASYSVDVGEIKTRFVLEMIDAAAEALGSTSPQKAQLLRRETMSFIENIEMEAARKGELFPPTRELLSFLKANNISCAVVSRNCQKAIFTVFPEILCYCDAVFCRDAVKKVKPDPLHLHAALKQVKGSAASALMVGDHPLDIEAGRRAGTLTAGVLTGNFQAADFWQAGADIVLSQASCLREMFA